MSCVRKCGYLCDSCWVWLGSGSLFFNVNSFLCLWLRIDSVFLRDVTISALRLYVFLDLQLPYDAAQQFIPESPTAVDIFKSWSKAHFFSLAFKSNRDQYGIIIRALTFCVVPLLSFMCILNFIHLQMVRCTVVNIVWFTSPLWIE